MMRNFLTDVLTDFCAANSHSESVFRQDFDKSVRGISPAEKKTQPVLSIGMEPSR